MKLKPCPRAVPSEPQAWPLAWVYLYGTSQISQRGAGLPSLPWARLVHAELVASSHLRSLVAAPPGWAGALHCGLNLDSKAGLESCSPPSCNGEPWETWEVSPPLWASVYLQSEGPSR